MRSITTKQYQIMTDQMAIWDFMTEIYDRTWANGVAAPFFEYALSSTWMDTSYLHQARMWREGERIVAFVFNESPITDVYFSLRPGYEALAEEMIAYAEEHICDFGGKRQFILFEGQKALMQAAAKRGYTRKDGHNDMQFVFTNELNYPLPEGFSFVQKADIDPLKLALCCWKGFNHEEDEGPFVNWDARDDTTAWTPAKAMRGINKSLLAPPPHSTQQYDVIIQDDKGEYACYSGMWWVPKNQLAYMEPLCTIPAHRHKGLASAALTAHYRRMKALGATHMTGGSGGFYARIGYEPAVLWTYWNKR